MVSHSLDKVTVGTGKRFTDTDAKTDAEGFSDDVAGLGVVPLASCEVGLVPVSLGFPLV